MLNQSQFSHTHLERPAQVPSFLSVGQVTNGIPGHPLNEAVIGKLSGEITRMVVMVAAHNATKNHLRIYMWNQISSDNFMNPYLKRLVAMTTDCVLLQTASFASVGGSTEQLVSAIRSCATQCCEIFAAINAIEVNPILLAGVDQAGIMHLYQLATKMRENIVMLRQKFAAGAVNSGGMLDIDRWGISSSESNKTDIMRALVASGGLSNGNGDSINSLSFGQDSLTPDIFNNSRPSHVTDFDQNFGVMESLDSILYEDPCMTTDDNKWRASDQIPIPAAEPKPTPENRVSFRDENGDTLSLISTDVAIIKKLVDNYVPSRNRQHIADVYRPSYQKLGVFHNGNNNTHILAVFNEGEMNRDLHYKLGAPGLDIGIVVPPEILGQSFTDVNLDAGSAPIDPPTNKLDGVNIVSTSTSIVVDDLNSVIESMVFDARTADGVFAIKQQLFVSKALYMLAHVRQYIVKSIEDVKAVDESQDSTAANNVGIRQFTATLSTIVDTLIEQMENTSGQDLERMKATLESLNVLEEALTESVNNALHYNLGIPASQLRITSVMDDWADLISVLTTDFDPAFSRALLEHQEEIVSRAIAVIDNNDVEMVTAGRMASIDSIRNNNVITAVPIRITAISVGTEELDIAVIPEIGMTFDSADESLKTFMSNVYEDCMDLGGRVLLATQSGDVFELHKPWLVEDRLAKLVISKL